MDIITQLQEKANEMSALTFNMFGTLQRDAPPARISPNYPEPPANPNQQDPATFAEQAKTMSAELVKAAKQFDSLIDALPSFEGGEEAQLKRIAELQGANDAIGEELQKQLEAAEIEAGTDAVQTEKELKQVQDLFNHVTDDMFSMKRPE